MKIVQNREVQKINAINLIKFRCIIKKHNQSYKK